VAALGIVLGFTLAIGLSLSYRRSNAVKTAPPSVAASPVAATLKEAPTAAVSPPAPGITTQDQPAVIPSDESPSVKMESLLRTTSKPSSSVSASAARAKKPSAAAAKKPRTKKLHDVRSAIED